MKTLLAWIGGVVVIFAILGSLDIGNFVLMYGPDKMVCTKAMEEQ